ncbi:MULTISPECIES: prefoldin subunit [Thermococcus]|uniref:ATP-binding protein n=1 Tax=Thermococcus barossii TaxID=54077 RepID=A0A2Z2MRG5_9EURY|nr:MULTISPECIES: prefoldin subunit [Thermococcus]ASJ04498.1 ATP-binding protein [Thermococcus barossii]NJE75848.1 ATP-binding protein [Thermococcus sp. ES12]
MELVRAYEKELELQRLRELRASLELKLAEVNEAKKYLKSGDRKLYRLLSGLLVEVSGEEAREHLESIEMAYRRELERLKRREGEILEELQELKAHHS